MSNTTLIYNGVTFQECQTLRFDQDVFLDESNTDLLYHRITIRIASSIHAQAFDTVFGVRVGSEQNPATATMQIRGHLLHPRAKLQYIVGGVTLVQAQPTPGQVDSDLNNGPRPISCSVVHVAGQQAFRIEFEIEVAVLSCLEPSVVSTVNNQQLFGAKQDNRVLSNRWSIAETMDENMYRDRTWAGTLRVAHYSFYPHLFRHMVVPPLQRGYKRNSMRFVQSEDGLSLRYEVMDRQKYAKPPAPAIDWSASYTEATGVGGAVGHASMNIMLTGPPDVDRKKLLVPAAQIVQARLGNLQRGFADGGSNQLILMGAAIVEHLHANTVEMRVQIKRVPAAHKFLNNVVDKIGRDLDIPDYDPKQWPVPLLYDSDSPSGVFASYLQHPCNPFHGITGVQALANTQADGEEEDYDPQDADYFRSTGDVDEDVDEGLSSSQLDSFPYTHIEMDNVYDLTSGTVALPIASTLLTANVASVEIIDLHNPVAERVYSAHVERAGAWPQLPKPVKVQTDPNGIEEFLAEVKMIPEPPFLLPDGKTLLYRAQIKYRYLLSRAPTTDEALRVGSPQWDATAPNDNLFIGTLTFVGDIV